MPGQTFTVQARVGARRRAATRERILDAARRILERGESVAELTVARLAAEAEVSRATFYLHFPDKRHLVEALFASALEEWEEIAADALTDPELSRAQLRAVLHGGVVNGVKYGAVVAGIVELGEYDPEARAAWQGQMRRAAENHTSWVRACRPDLDDRQAVLLGQVLTWAFERSMQRMVGIRDEAWCDADELADTFTELWWALAHPATA